MSEGKTQTYKPRQGKYFASLLMRQEYLADCKEPANNFKINEGVVWL